jgi:hypothetical protein
MLEMLMAKDLVYAAAGNMYAHPKSPQFAEKLAEIIMRIASVLSVLSIHIINIHRGEAGVRMISEHRARFCMLILDQLQDRLPVVAAFFPIYESLLNRKSADVQRTSPAKVQERPATRRSMQNEGRQLDNESDSDSMSNTGGLFDQLLQDNMGTSFPFSFPFSNLFEDILLGSPQPTAYCEDMS